MQLVLDGNFRERQRDSRERRSRTESSPKVFNSFSLGYARATISSSSKCTLVRCAVVKGGSHDMLTCSAERSTSLTIAEVPASWPHGAMSEMWSLTAGDSSGCSRS